MSKVTVTDSNQTTLTAVPVNPDPLSAIVKYAQSPELNLILLPDAIQALGDPLKKAAATPVSLGVQLGKAFNFGAGQPQLSISAGATAAVHVNAKAGADLFSDNLYQSQITVKDGEGYLSLALTGSVTGKDSQSSGDITFGFQAGASATFEYFRSFQVSDTAPLVGEALGQVISGFIMPADVTDLRALKTGDVATCSGNRNLKISASFSASVSAVPLATPTLPLANKAVQLNAGAKISVTGSYEISSAWQIRSQAVSDGVIELGVYKQHGADWDIGVTASAGVDVSVGSTDLLTALIDKLSTAPAADKQQLQASGLDADQIKAINSAISSSIDHSVHASVSLDLKGLDSDEAAFLYRIELDKLNADTANAVTAALDGDLTVMDRLNPQAQENGLIGPGLTLVRSILTDTKEHGVTFKMNFIGLFNFISLADFISKSQVIHEPASGDTVFKETASGERIDAISLPQAQTKLRKAIFDSVLMTTTYRSAGVLESMGMECSAVHFAVNSSTNEHTLSDYLDWFLALGVLTPQGKAAIMSGFRGSGASMCVARVAFNDAACQALFLDGAGDPRKAGVYVSIGRSVLAELLLPPPGDGTDSDAYRRAVLGNDSIWKQFEAQGQANIGTVMQATQNWSLGDSRIATLSADYTVIEWWAAAMASTALQIVDMQSFLKTADPATLQSNKAFLAKRDDVQKHVLGVIQNSPMSYDRPFGLVALAWAAGTLAGASGTLQAPGISQEFGTAAAAQAGK